MSIQNETGHLNRRAFVQAVGAGTAVLMSQQSMVSAATASPSRDFEYGNPLKEFHYSSVSFAPGLHETQLQQTHAVLMGLNENSLLRPFRARAGLDAPGAELGGWYSSDGFCPAHSFGQWLSALSRYYAITGDEQTRAMVHRLVEGFAATVEPTGKFYRRYPHARGYSYDLLALGLIDAHRFAHQPTALPALAGTTKAAAKYLPGKAVPSRGELKCEADEKCYDHTYVIPENQFIAWQQGGEALHLEMARHYLFDEIFNPLSRGENVLGGLHAYTHLNALCSAAKAYLVMGDEKYLRAAKNGFAFVDAQSYATGGWGPNESFLPVQEDPESKSPAINDLGDGLEKTHKSFETPCGAYTHFKLARYLLRISKDSSYGDSLERVMYNTVLGAKPIQQDGQAFYFSDYAPGARKAYLVSGLGPEKDKWPCCAGSLPQVATDYRISTYFQDEEGVFVNLYIPSTLRWRQNGAQMTLTQSGQYPLDDEIALSITSSKSSRFALRLRIPEWARGASIHVNGKAMSSPVHSGTFATIRRDWKSGDRIELKLPRSFELKAVDARHPDVVALVYGPLVLFAVSDDAPSVTRTQLLGAVQQGSGSSEWRVDSAAGSLRFTPFWAIKDEAYFTYLKV